MKLDVTIIRGLINIIRGWPKEDWGDKLCTATGFVLTFTGNGRVPYVLE